MKWEWEGHGKETANVVSINKIIPSKDDHPTPKPVELITHFLRLHGKPGDVVLDPFMGAGPVAEACKNLGLRFIGIEIDEKWCEMAVKSIKRPKWGEERPMGNTNGGKRDGQELIAL